METLTIKNQRDQLHKALDFIKNGLANSKASSKYVLSANMLAEDSIVVLMENLPQDTNITIITYRSMGMMNIKIEAEGTNLEKKLLEQDSPAEIDVHSPNAAAAIRGLIFKAHRDKYTFFYKNGINTVHIIVGEPYMRQAMITVYTMVAAVVIGLLLKFLCPSSLCDAINVCALTPIITIFMNLLTMMIGPIIFFSIASSVSSMSDFSELGKIGGRLIAFYMMTSLLVTFIALGLSYTFQMCDFNMLTHMNLSQNSVATAAPANTSNLIDFVVGLFPSNILTPFIEDNALQLVVLAILMGLTAASLVHRVPRVAQVLEICNEFFMSFINMITSFLPIMIFCSIMQLMFSMNLELFTYLSRFIGVLLLGYASIIVMYMILVLLMTRQNPITFLKNILPAYLTAFTTRSSNATLPTSMNVCKNSLGISPVVYSFSLPLGATINMDGACVLLLVSSIFFARGFGVTLTVSQLAALVFLVLATAMSSPGSPGAGVALAAAVFASVGIPSACLALYIPINSLMDSFTTSGNVIGDVAGTYIISYLHGYIKKPASKG